MVSLVIVIVILIVSVIVSVLGSRARTDSLIDLLDQGSNACSRHRRRGIYGTIFGKWLRPGADRRDPAGRRRAVPAAPATVSARRRLE